MARTGGDTTHPSTAPHSATAHATVQPPHPSAQADPAPTAPHGFVAHSWHLIHLPSHALPPWPPCSCRSVSRPFSMPFPPSAKPSSSFLCRKRPLSSKPSSSVTTLRKPSVMSGWAPCSLCLFQPLSRACRLVSAEVNCHSPLIPGGQGTCLVQVSISVPNTGHITDL